VNPLCPDPSYPEWDAVAQGCKAAARAVAETPSLWPFYVFALVIAGLIGAVRWFDVD
jgi:hypothetical protein